MVVYFMQTPPNVPPCISTVAEVDKQ